MLGILGNSLVSLWTSWTVCPQKCRRDVIQRTRECNSTITDLVEHTCGLTQVSTKEEQDCLILDGCNGTRNYMADIGLTCTVFCKQIGNDSHPARKIQNSHDGGLYLYLTW